MDLNESKQNQKILEFLIYDMNQMQKEMKAHGILKGNHSIVDE